MRYFAVVAGLAAAANAQAYGYPAQNATSVAPPSYGSPTPAGYAVSSAVKYSAAVVTGLSTVCTGPTVLSIGTKVYTVTKSTTIIDQNCVYTTTVPVGPKPTPPVGGSSAPAGSAPRSTPAGGSPSGGSPSQGSPSQAQASGSSSQASPAPGKPIPGAPVYSAPPPAGPYQSQNGSAPNAPGATGAPTGTKPAPSQFTGAAGQNGVAMLAIVGAVAAFL